ncbi:unnamed protein product [Enterobius vermicularis]|uniref:ShKT domain-containing protein n=1 Tax=Enterobius vermicularis TaxID=51028 RepID=A0A0N4USJ1_ENTVE|nr:unnamed protein product [Enterobius vermicularis]
MCPLGQTCSIGVCFDLEPTTTTTTPTTTTTSSNCYETVMRTQCPKTCGFCSDEGNNASLIIFFLINLQFYVYLLQNSDCSSLQYLCQNAAYRSLMQQQCPRTCGYCTAQKLLFKEIVKRIKFNVKKLLKLFVNLKLW